MDLRPDISNNLRISLDGPRALFKVWAFFNSIPKDGFIPRSFSSVALSLEPDTDVRKILMEDEKKHEIVSLSEEKCCLEIILRHKDGVLVVSSNHGHLAIEIARSDYEAKSQAAELKDLFEPHILKNKEEDGVWADHTHLTSQGPQRVRQFLKCPRWDTVKQNYTGTTAKGVEDLMELENPWERGRLVIWSGDPGTGKTYALRSLMMKWRDRFEFVIVTDPEKLTANPGYYFEVAGESSEEPERYGPRRRKPSLMAGRMASRNDDEEEEPKRRVLFVMEDAADLIMPESRQNHFDKIGKLLNITDGLFGQGREDLFLVTFNEKVEKIDPAFIRPGRCITRTEFGKFDAKAAQAWLKQKEAHDTHAAEEMTLAELYGKLYDPTLKGEAVQKGFGR